MEWRIREAATEDAGALALIAGTCFLETYCTLLPGPDITAFCAKHHIPPVYETLIAEPGCQVWLAETATGAPVGYMVTGSPDLPEIETGAGDVELKRIYSLAPTHGSGLGRAFLDTAIDHARTSGAPRLLLGVFSKNTRAIAFYKKHGFQELGTRHFQVGITRCDDFILGMDLG